MDLRFLLRGVCEHDSYEQSSLFPVFFVVSTIYYDKPSEMQKIILNCSPQEVSAPRLRLL